MHEHEVIIVGAGAAGLAAASALGRQRSDVLVIEARDRTGGRVYTQRGTDSSLPIELGADFIHGRAPETFRLVGEGGVDVYEFNGEDWHFRGGRLTRSGGFWSKVAQINAKLEKYRDRDISFAEFLARECAQEDAEAVEAAQAFVEGFHAARTERVSVQSLLLSEEASDVIDGEQQYRIRSGYDSLIAVLDRELASRRIEIRLGTILERVVWRRGSAELHVATNDGPQVLRARRVLITLPLGVMKAAKGERGAVEFAPELTQKREALGRLEMGAVMKLVLNFRTPFWREIRTEGGSLERMGFLHAAGEPFPTWWTTAPEESTLLTGWTGGPGAERLSLLKEQQILNAGLTTLAKLFTKEKSELRGMLRSQHLHVWQTDPYSRGSYSYVGVGGTNAPRELAATLEDTLYFAGEATAADGHFGTVHGALQSGYRAAEEILRSISE